MVPPSKQETCKIKLPGSSIRYMSNSEWADAWAPPCNNCSYKYFLPSHGAALPDLLSQPLQERFARQLVLWFTSRHWTRLTCLKQLLVLKESSQIALGPCATGNTTTTACRPYSVRADLQNLDVAHTVFIHLSRNGPSYSLQAMFKELRHGRAYPEIFHEAIPSLLNAVLARCLHTQQAQDPTTA